MSRAALANPVNAIKSGIATTNSDIESLVTPTIANNPSAKDLFQSFVLLFSFYILSYLSKRSNKALETISIGFCIAFPYVNTIRNLYKSYSRLRPDC